MTQFTMIDELSRPEAYEHAPQAVQMLQTHISWVFLAGELVYKVKKPVNFGFLDFTDLSQRKWFCEEEIRLNRRLSPDIYLGVVPVTRDDRGRHRMDGPGEVVDFAVKMRRMPEDGMMLTRLASGRVTSDTLEQIASILVDFYGRADTGPEVNEFGRPERIKVNTDENFAQTRDYVDVALSEERYETIRGFTDRFLAEEAPLLSRRIDGGFIRDCHGDLHMANICIDRTIWIFDCIEFNQRFRFSDVASDLAFLAMDLDFHGRSDLARHLVQAYVRESDDTDLPRVLDFYKCYRAYVRGKIHCFTFDQPAVPAAEREKALGLARRYFDLAYRYADGRRRPRILVFFGIMGSGKTNWAQAAGLRLGVLPISSDRVRKQSAGLSAGTRVYVPFGEGLYTSDMSQKVYRSMHEAAAKLAGAGMDVILDASYMKEAERRNLLAAADAVDAEVTFVHTVADEQTILSRLMKREEEGRSISDGRREIYVSQLENFDALGDLSPARLVTLDTVATKDEVGNRLWAALGF